MDKRIAMAQTNPVVGDFDSNAEGMLKYVREARELGADVVIFPELAVTGYPPKDLLLKQGFIRQSRKVVGKIVRASKNITVIFGMVDIHSDKLYNAAAIARNGKLVGIQYKTILPNYDVFDEKRYFEPARTSKVFRIGGSKLGITICEDIWQGGPVKSLISQGADLLINISASPFYAGKGRERKKLLSDYSKKYNVPFIYVNMVGGADDLIFDGQSYLFSSKGNLIAAGKPFSEDLLVTGLEGSKIAVKDDNVENIYNALVLGVRDYVRKNSFKKVVVGISGGIDSAVTAAIAVAALGKESVVGVSMPSEFTSERSMHDAEEIARNLGILFIELPITDIYKTYLSTLSGEFSGTKSDTAEENIQARIRGNLLMGLSNKFGYLVLSTGNKSELAVGYCTLYGDMTGGLAVLSDVYKTMVYRIADYINKKNYTIPDQVIDRAPSAELWPGQRDTDTLPPYDQLDPVLELFIEDGLTAKEIIAKGYKKTMVERVISMVDQNEFKRQQAPLGLKVSRLAFGRGRRMPIVNKYRP